MSKEANAQQPSLKILYHMEQKAENRPCVSATRIIAISFALIISWLGLMQLSELSWKTGRIFPKHLGPSLVASPYLH